MADTNDQQEGNMPEGGGVNTMFTVSVLQTQLKDLETKYGRALREIVELRGFLQGDKAEQADIYYYLQKKLDDNYASMAELEAQYLQEQADREHAENIYESRIKNLQNELSTTKDRLEDKVVQLEEKLIGLQDFAARRQEIEDASKGEIEACQEAKARAKALVYDMEKKCIRDKEALRQDMFVKIEETKASLEGVAQEKVDEMTRKTFKDKLRLKRELQFQNRETERIITLNKGFMKENKELRYLLNLSKHTELEMSRKLGKYRRVLKRQQEHLIQAGVGQLEEMTTITSVCTNTLSGPSRLHHQHASGNGQRAVTHPTFQFQQQQQQHSLYDDSGSVVSDLGEEASASQWLPDIGDKGMAVAAARGVNFSSPADHFVSSGNGEGGGGKGRGGKGTIYPAAWTGGGSGRRRRRSSEGSYTSQGGRGGGGIEGQGSFGSLSHGGASASTQKTSVPSRVPPPFLMDDLSSIGSQTTTALTSSVRVDQMRRREKALKSKNRLRNGHVNGGAGVTGGGKNQNQKGGGRVVEKQQGGLIQMGKKIKLRRPPGCHGGEGMGGKKQYVGEGVVEGQCGERGGEEHGRECRWWSDYEDE